MSAGIVIMETLGGFPNLPALWLRRAKPACAYASADGRSASIRPVGSLPSARAELDDSLADDERRIRRRGTPPVSRGQYAGIWADRSGASLTFSCSVILVDKLQHRVEYDTPLGMAAGVRGDAMTSSEARAVDGCARANAARRRQVAVLEAQVSHSLPADVPST